MRYIHFKNVKITNFLSIGKKPVEVVFKPGINVITGRNYDKVDRANGVGKSTITDAIHFALYGDTIRELKKENIVNDQAPDALCEVELEFNVEFGGVYKDCKIVRSINPTKCFFYINNEDVTRSGMPQTTELIVETIKTSSAVFQNSVIMSINNTVPFMAQKKVEKRKFIEGILGLEVFSNMLQLARNDFNETKKLLEIETTKLEEILRALQDLVNQKQIYDASKIKKIAELQTKYDNNERELAVLIKKIKDIGVIDDGYQAVITEAIRLAVALQSSLNDEASTINASMAVAKSHLENDNKLLAEMKPPVKNESVSESDVEKTIQNLENQLAELGKTDDSELIKIKDNLEALKSSIDKLTIKYNEYQSNIITCESKIEVCKQALKDLKRPDKKCPHCNKNIEEAGVAHYEEIKKQFEADIVTHTEKLKVSQVAKTKVEDKLAEIKAEIKKLEILNNGFYVKAQEANVIKQKLEQAKTLLVQIIKDTKNYYKEITKFEEIKTKLIQTIADNNSILNNGTKLQAKILVQVNDAKKALDTQNKKLSDFLVKKQELESYTLRKTDLVHWQEEIKIDINQLNANSNTFQESIDNTNIRADTSKQLIASYQEKIDIIESAKFITSEEGVKSYIVKKILQVLNTRLLTYLKKLESNCLVKFNEFFEEIITNERGKECSYFNFSGAERKAIDLAMLFTFQDIRRAQADVGINLSMFDELLDSSLDEKGIDLVLDILKERVNVYNEAVYIISHRKECKKYCTTGEVIFLEKKSGITTRASHYDPN